MVIGLISKELRQGDGHWIDQQGAETGNLFSDCNHIIDRRNVSKTLKEYQSNKKPEPVQL